MRPAYNSTRPRRCVAGRVLRMTLRRRSQPDDSGDQVEVTAGPFGSRFPLRAWWLYGAFMLLTASVGLPSGLAVYLMRVVMPQQLTQQQAAYGAALQVLKDTLDANRREESLTVTELRASRSAFEAATAVVRERR